MLARLLAAAGTFAIAANAALLPPKFPSSALNANVEPAAATPTGHLRAHVQLACHSCPIAVGSTHGHPVRWADGPDTQLLIDIASDGQQIYFNGVPIYPLTPNSIGHLLSAQQVYADYTEVKDIKEQLYTHPLPLSSGIKVHAKVEMLSFHLDTLNIKEAVEKVPMRSLSIEIMGLASKTINVDTIRIKFSDDKLEIHDVAIVPIGSEPSSAADACTTVQCRIRTAFKAQMAQIQSMLKHKMHGTSKKPACNKHKPAKGAAGLIKGGAAKFQGKFTSEGKFKGFQGHHQHHHKHHSKAQCLLLKIASFSYHIVLPVTIGIAAGLLVSGIGMLMGQLVVYVFGRLFFRQSDYELVEQDEFILIEDDYETEPLPKYEDVYIGPPAFDEKPVPQ